MKLPKGFIIQELVPPEVYKELGDRAIWCLCPNALKVLGQLHEDYGAIVVNNWNTGGTFKYSGFRPKNCTEGAVWSQHRFGRAFDCKFKSQDVKNVRAEVSTKARAGHVVYSLIGGIELDVSWFHFDTRVADALMEFRP